MVLEALVAPLVALVAVLVAVVAGGYVAEAGLDLLLELGALFGGDHAAGVQAGELLARRAAAGLFAPVDRALALHHLVRLVLLEGLVLGVARGVAGRELAELARAALARLLRGVLAVAGALRGGLLAPGVLVDLLQRTSPLSLASVLPRHPGSSENSNDINSIAY